MSTDIKHFTLGQLRDFAGTNFLPPLFKYYLTQILGKSDHRVVACTLATPCPSTIRQKSDSRFGSINYQLLGFLASDADEFLIVITQGMKEPWGCFEAIPHHLIDSCVLLRRRCAAPTKPWITWGVKSAFTAGINARKSPPANAAL